MKLSHGTRVKDINSTNGYGYATDRMTDSLRRLGHTIEQNDPTAPVEMWFDQPHHWTWRDNQYKIGYHPWESTKLKDDWVERMNKCDEIWTPSPLIAEWYAEDGIKRPIHVYQHGVDKIWAPKKRNLDDGVIKFLHVGGEAARKSAHQTMVAFRKAFPDRTDVKLTMKMINPGWNINKIGKIEIINETMSLPRLVNLFQEHHIYVYPSYGEGFGLTPLQAISTGMPTVTVPDWAPYGQFLDERLNIKSTLRRSPWHNNIHPGKMFRPDFDDLIDRMRFAAENFEMLHSDALSRTEQISKAYDWDDLTAEAFKNLENRLK